MKSNSNTAGIILILLLMTVTCTMAQKTEGGKPIALKPKDFKSKLSSTPGAVLVDVRTPDEFSEGVIKGAINIDYRDPSFEKKISSLDNRIQKRIDDLSQPVASPVMIYN